MVVSKIVSVRRVAAAAAMAAALLCGQVHAQVLKNVPADAMAVLEFKSLEKTNAKVAKLAKDWGLDELSPEMKDPLAAMLAQGKVTKGINKDGDAAMVFFAPDKEAHEAKDEPVVVAIIPVSDYEAFVGNFEKAAKESGVQGVTAVKDHMDSDKTVYIAHHGKYAIMSDHASHLKGDGGLKLSKLVQKEVDEKDAVFIVNMPAVRDKALPAIKKHRNELINDMHKELADKVAVKPYVPVLDTLVNLSLDKAVEFLESADGIAASIDIETKGIMTGTVIEFAPDSAVGKAVAKLKPNDIPLLAGLPEGKYMFVGGASIDYKAVGPIADAWIDPVAKSLKETDTELAHKLLGTLDLAKQALASAEHSAAGIPVPTKPLGQESVVQEVSVVYGDAKEIAGAQKKLLAGVNDLMALVPRQGAESKFVFGEPKTIDGIELQTYTNKIEFDKNDPQAAQVEQVLGLVYGPNGMSGAYGAVSSKAMIATQGAGDDLIKELIASAKSGKDVLSDTPGIKATAALLPADRSIVYYVALDNIITTSLRYAAGFGFAVPFKLPHELPPIGVAAGVDGASIRVDAAIPSETVQSIIAASLKAYTDFQGAKGGL